MGTVGLISFLCFGLLGLVAWADYSDRGCSEIWGQQCGDAFYTMTYSSLISVMGLIFITLAGWTAIRLFRRQADKAPLWRWAVGSCGPLTIRGPSRLGSRQVRTTRDPFPSRVWRCQRRSQTWSGPLRNVAHS